jgi:glutaredoxin 3
MYLFRPLLTITLSISSASSFSAAHPSTKRAFSSTCLKMSSAADFAKSEIEQNKVVVFSKSYCPYCTKTKDLFASLKVDAQIHELDKMDSGADIQAALLDMTGQRTVPNVFINGQHIGGNDATQAANASGKLKELLAA